MRTIGIILVLALWLILGWKMCSDHAACCADATLGAAESSEEVGLASGESTTSESTFSCSISPICFQEGSSNAVKGNQFNQFRDSIVNALGANQVLQVTGLYTSSEDSKDGTNIGSLRASSIRNLFSDLVDERFVLSDQIVVGRTLQSGERYRLSIVDAPDDDSSDSGNEGDGRDGESSSSTSGISSSAVIYFPFNSTNKLDDRDIENYLDQVAARIVNSGESIRLTGHTDDIGNAESNVTLGQRRANIIADYLMGKGVRRAQIVAQSRGESQPVASNTTEVGRAQNRRTELQIIQ